MRYELEYTYYQYNSGAADNGTYTKRIKYKTREEAQKAKADIDAAAKAHEEGRHSDADDTEDRFIPYMGYFKKPATIFEIEERQIA